MNINEIKQNLKDQWRLQYYVKVHSSKESLQIHSFFIENNFWWSTGNDPELNTILNLDYYILHYAYRFTLQYYDGEPQEKHLLGYDTEFLDFSDFFPEKNFVNNLFDEILK